MKVRGWLMIGDASASYSLPPGNDVLGGSLRLGGPLPNASDYQPGDWMRWAPTPEVGPMTLVCVDIPL